MTSTDLCIRLRPDLNALAQDIALTRGQTLAQMVQDLIENEIALGHGNCPSCGQIRQATAPSTPPPASWICDRIGQPDTAQASPLLGSHKD